MGEGESGCLGEGDASLLSQPGNYGPFPGRDQLVLGEDVTPG